jgi:hypothetical protein
LSAQVCFKKSTKKTFEPPGSKVTENNKICFKILSEAVKNGGH